jgi:hypothetical protein
VCAGASREAPRPSLAIEGARGVSLGANDAIGKYVVVKKKVYGVPPGYLVSFGYEISESVGGRACHTQGVL